MKNTYEDSNLISEIGNKKVIVIFFGTRPEIIKLFVLYKVLKDSDEFYPILYNTSQQKILDDILESLNIECEFKAEDIPNRSSDINELLSHLLIDFNKKFSKDILKRENISGIIVQGDTASAFAGALWGFFNRIPVFHVEAGLRTFDRDQPFPEEFIRESIAKATTLHFCPSGISYNNLHREGVSKDKLFVVGNTINDAMLNLLSEGLIREPEENNYLLSTLHRRENWSNVSLYAVILNNITKRFNDYYSYVYHLLHPNPMIKQTFETVLNGSRHEKLKLREPINNYFEMLGLVKSSSCILTDSGGLQEESIFFNIPCGVLREKTERPEVLEVNAKLLPFNEMKVTNFVEYAKEYKRDNKEEFNYTYGSGNTSKQIYKILKDYFCC